MILICGDFSKKVLLQKQIDNQILQTDCFSYCFFFENTMRLSDRLDKWGSYSFIDLVRLFIDQFVNMIQR